ncbi:MAG: hypothetical protein U0237_06960 [Thermoleophilia bacterium]
MSRDDPRDALGAVLAAALGDEGALALLALMGAGDPVAALGLQGLPVEISAPPPEG